MSFYVLRHVIRQVLRATAKLPLRPSSLREQRLDTLTHVFAQLAGFIVFSVSILMILSELDINIAPVLTGAGIIGLAVGFGAQDLVKNLVSGIFILLEDQYIQGDTIKIAGIEGVVENFGLRKTVIRDAEGVVHHIPNGEVGIVGNKSR